MKNFFTFGFGSKYSNCFIKIEGSVAEARLKMFEIFGDKWAFQYTDKEWYKDGISQQEKYNLKELFLKDFKK